MGKLPEPDRPKTLRQRVQELSAEYWEARNNGMTERVAIAQTHIYLARVEGFTPAADDEVFDAANT